MTQPQPVHRYPGLMIGLHWLMAILIFIALAMGYVMVDLPYGEWRAWFFRHHKNIGLTVALLFMARLAWRLRHDPPALPSSMDWREKRLAHVAHVLLYLLMALVPATGYMATSFTEYPTYYLGIPVNIAAWGGDAEHANAFFGGLHTWLAYTLLAVVLAHMLGAFRHLFIRRDGVFQRMWPKRLSN